MSEFGWRMLTLVAFMGLLFGAVVIFLRGVDRRDKIRRESREERARKKKAEEARLFYEQAEPSALFHTRNPVRHSSGSADPLFFATGIAVGSSLDDSHHDSSSGSDSSSSDGGSSGSD